MKQDTCISDEREGGIEIVNSIAVRFVKDKLLISIICYYDTMKMARWTTSLKPLSANLIFTSIE